MQHHIATPHGLQFRHAAALYSCDHVQVGSIDDLHNAVAALLSSRTTIIEVRTGRHANRELHATVERTLLNALNAL